MTYYDVVMKLVGPVRPVGEHGTDMQRLENLRALTELVDNLVTEIDDIATDHADSHEASRKECGEHCKRFLDALGIEE